MQIMRVVVYINAFCAGYWHFMMLTLSIFWKKGSVEYSGMFTQTCMSVLHENQDSLDVWNCKLGLNSRKTWSFANIKVQTSLCIGSLISTFAIRLLENIVSRLASIKYTLLFQITVISSMIDLIFSFSSCETAPDALFHYLFKWGI